MINPSDGDWNRDNPSSLLNLGVLKGKAILLDSSPFVYLPGSSRRISIGKLLENAAVPLEDGESGVVAVKIVEDSRQNLPRDLRREAKLLSKMDHSNVLALLNAYLIPSTQTRLSTFYLFTPLYPLSLSTLLQSHTFNSELDSFDIIVHSLAWQMNSAIAYIHSQGIAHRDIGPGNFVIARNGRLVLIDFGISIEKVDEKAGEMYFEVGTGAPELLFGARSYDIFAIDLWALGVTLTDLFTSFSTLSPPSPSSSKSSKSSGRWDDDDLDSHFSSPTTTRQTLFKGDASDFVLIGSIFKIRGTPTLETWPEAKLLPDFSRFTFSPQDPIPLESLLPHLPPSPSPILPIIEELLVISASKRLNAGDALSHSLWREVAVQAPEDVELGKLFEQFM